jgi:hypothetical protein
MSARNLTIIVFVLLLAGAGLFGYFRWSEARQKVDLWTLVPADAVAAMESNNLEGFYTALRKTALWDSFSQFRYIQQAQEHLALLDSASGRPNAISKFLKSKEVIVSLHVVNNTDFDLLYLVPISTVSEHRFVRSLTEGLEKAGRVTYELRDYQGYEIAEARLAGSKQELSYFSYHNNLIVSANAGLLEAVIRNIERDELASPLAKFKALDVKQSGVWGKVWLNFKELPVFLSLFLKEELHGDLSFLSSLCQTALLELKVENDQLFLNGFSKPYKAPGSLYEQLKKQKSRTIGFRDLVPLRTAVLVSMGGEKLPRIGPGSFPREEPVYDSLHQLLNTEVALAWLASYQATSARPEKLLLARLTDPVAAQSLLSQLPAPGSQRPKIQTEKAISLIDLPEVPERIFGPLARGFEQTYVMRIGEYLLLAESEQVLKELLADIENETVWGKSAAQVQYLSQAQQEANLSVFIHTANSWNILSQYLEPSRQEHLQRNATLLKRFGQISLQFSNTGKQYFTTLLVRHQSREAADEGETTLNVVSTATFKVPLRPVLYPLPARSNAPAEAFVQDSANVLYLLSPESKVRWTDSLPGPVIGEPVLLGKRYGVATARQIHLLEPNGKQVEGYPLNLPDSVKLTHLSAFPDGTSGLVAADFQGNLYWFDPNGSPREGWSPRPAGQPLTVAPQTLIINGQAVVMCFLNDGSVLALDQYGEPFSGFPLNLDQPIRGEAFSRPGPNLNRSLFTVMTAGGVVTTFNLLGDIVKRDQVLKTSRYSRFELISEASDRSYALVRQDQGKLTIFGPDLKPLMETSFITSSAKKVQFFQFGTGRKLFAVTEPVLKKTSLFSASGKLLGKKPFENRHPLRILSNEARRTYQFELINGRQIRNVSVQQSAR